MLTFTILGDPIAQKRPRFVRGSHAFSPQQKDKDDLRVIIQEKAPQKPILAPVGIKIAFYFPRPKSHFGTGKNSGKLKASAPRYHTGRKDLDNLYKFYTDAMNGIIYKDDGQIVHADLEKNWTDGTPKTLIEIIPLTNDA